jgi:hypothetical protein
MPRKEWTAAVNGHDIRVVNSWTGGTALYIDGECRDRNPLVVGALEARRPGEWLGGGLCRSALFGESADRGGRSAGRRRQPLIASPSVVPSGTS